MDRDHELTKMELLAYQTFYLRLEDAEKRLQKRLRTINELKYVHEKRKRKTEINAKKSAA